MTSQSGGVYRNGSRGIHLILGGGGARGLAHLGVLQVLEREHIPIELIAANSAGSIAAAAYLQRGSAERTEREFLRYLSSSSFRRLKLGMRLERSVGAAPENSFVSRLMSGWRRQVAMQLLFRRQALFHQKRLETIIHSVVSEGRIEDLPIRLLILALDLKTGEEVFLEQGEIRQSLIASSAVPGFFPPVIMGSRTLIDAGQANNLPLPLPVENHGSPVVAVNLSTELETRSDFETGIEIMFRAEEIGSLYNNRMRSRFADILIVPRMGGRHWLDFSNPESVILAGKVAAEEALPGIRRCLDEGTSKTAAHWAGQLDPLKRA